jgi:hypothetical protein
MPDYSIADMRFQGRSSTVSGTVPGERSRLLQEIKDPVKRAATSSQFQQYAGIPGHYSLELALVVLMRLG